MKSAVWQDGVDRENTVVDINHQPTALFYWLTLTDCTFLLVNVHPRPQQEKLSVLSQDLKYSNKPTKCMTS